MNEHETRVRLTITHGSPHTTIAIVIDAVICLWSFRRFVRITYQSKHLNQLAFYIYFGYWIILFGWRLTTITTRLAAINLHVVSIFVAFTCFGPVIPHIWYLSVIIARVFVYKFTIWCSSLPCNYYTPLLLNKIKITFITFCFSKRVFARICDCELINLPHRLHDWRQWMVIQGFFAHSPFSIHILQYLCSSTHPFLAFDFSLERSATKKGFIRELW